MLSATPSRCFGSVLPKRVLGAPPPVPQGSGLARPVRQDIGPVPKGLGLARPEGLSHPPPRAGPTPSQPGPIRVGQELASCPCPCVLPKVRLRRIGRVSRRRRMPAGRPSAPPRAAALPRVSSCVIPTEATGSVAKRRNLVSRLPPVLPPAERPRPPPYCHPDRSPAKPLAKQDEAEGPQPAPHPSQPHAPRASPERPAQMWGRAHPGRAGAGLLPHPSGEQPRARRPPRPLGRPRRALACHPRRPPGVRHHRLGCRSDRDEPRESRIGPPGSLSGIGQSLSTTWLLPAADP